MALKMSSLVGLGQTLLRTLPSNGVCWGCCYGSKVLEHKMSLDSQLDVLVVIHDSALESWHSENLKLNGHHYSSVNRLLGPK